MSCYSGCRSGLPQRRSGPCRNGGSGGFSNEIIPSSNPVHRFANFTQLPFFFPNRPGDHRTLCNFLRVSASHGKERYSFLSVGTNMAQPQLESTEAELIKRVCGGEPQAFEELLRPYERLVYATAISIMRNPSDAEEVAQEAVLKAFSKLSSFRGESKFSTWL